MGFLRQHSDIIGIYEAHVHVHVHSILRTIRLECMVVEGIESGHRVPSVII